MIPKAAIDKAREGGWQNWDNKFDAFFLEDVWEVIALDPSFWQTLGRGLGNKDVMRCNSTKCDYIRCEYGGYKDPKRMYTIFTETIWEGGDTETYWSELLKV